MNQMRNYVNRAKQSQKYLNFVDDGRYGFVNQPNLYANGNGGGTGAPSTGVKKSMPYAVTITSASGSNVADFDVLGAYEYINNAGFTAGGSLVVGSITIASAIPGVSYRELLYQSMNNPFTCGLTYLQSATAGQVVEPFTVITKDANGTAVTIPIIPAIDPYQQQSTVNAVEQEYRLDGFTKLRFSNILANATLTIRWYPSDNLNPARALGGQQTARTYANPGIIRR